MAWRDCKEIGYHPEKMRLDGRRGHGTLVKWMAV